MKNQKADLLIEGMGLASYTRLPGPRGSTKLECCVISLSLSQVTMMSGVHFRLQVGSRRSCDCACSSGLKPAVSILLQ